MNSFPAEMPRPIASDWNLETNSESNIHKLINSKSIITESYINQFLLKLNCKITDKKLISENYERGEIKEYNYTIVDNLNKEWKIYAYFHIMTYDDYEPYYSKFEIIT